MTVANTRFGQQNSKDGITKWLKVLSKHKQIGADLAGKNIGLRLNGKENSFGFTGIMTRTRRWRVIRRR